MNRIILAYSPENALLANSIDQQLSRIGIPFEHASGSIASQIAAAGEPVLLLVSDNFLLNRACMEGLLPVLVALAAENRLVAVLTDGQDAEGKAVPTKLDRMANALHYMKHWQDEWLALSDRHQHLEGIEKANLSAELDAMRGIANQVGDLISTLRDAAYLSLEQFEANDFEAFFQKFDLQDWHGQYKRLAAQTAESQALHQTPHLPEMSVSGGLLAPEPFADEEKSITIVEPELPRVPFIAVEKLKQDFEAKESSNDFSDPDAEKIEKISGAQSAARNAWFWIEKGHTQRGLDLFQTALEQFPESVWLKAEYDKALLQASPTELQSPESELQSLVLITGATSGIGRATAEIFAQNGYRLILTGRRVERLVELKTRFEAEFGSEILLLPFDVRDSGAVEAALSKLPDSFQNIDILVNNAGLAKGLAPIHEGNLEHWETMIDTNVKGLLYVSRLVSQGMVRRRQGHIINVGSSAGKEAYPNGNVYCATKFAVDALTKAMRFDLHTHNIRVGQVSPGHVEETEFAITRFDGDAERAKIYNDFQALKPSDVADAIYFMATRPPHVNIQDLQLFSTQQASSMVINRSGR